jgi:hypothetical protein
MNDRAADYYPPLNKRGASVQELLEHNTIPVPECGCWVWIGAVHKTGYGHVHRDRKLWKVHRLSWIHYVGPIPEGADVLHKCDLRPCINPDHLYLGNDLDNARDREQRGRGNHARGDRHFSRTMPEKLARGERNVCFKKPGIRAGENNGNAKLNREIVLAIRASTEKNGALAERYGVHAKMVSRIRNLKAWKSI